MPQRFPPYLPPQQSPIRASHRSGRTPPPRAASLARERTEREARVATMWRKAQCAAEAGDAGHSHAPEGVLVSSEGAGSLDHESLHRLVQRVAVCLEHSHLLLQDGCIARARHGEVTARGVFVFLSLAFDVMKQTQGGHGISLSGPQTSRTPAAHPRGKASFHSCAQCSENSFISKNRRRLGL